MHELHLAEDVLNKIKAEAKAKGIGKVSYARVAIGQALISDRAEFEELFAMISVGSVAEGMRLDLEIVPLKAACADCKTEFDAKIHRLDCSNCGSTNIQISSGKELLIESVV